MDTYPFTIVPGFPAVDRVRFYFRKPYNDKLQLILFTVCLFLGENDKILARGVSICSLSDTYSKTKGIHKAYGRATKALIRQENNEPIKPFRFYNEDISRKTKDGKVRVKLPYYYPLIQAAEEIGAMKSQYMPNPTRWENTHLFNKEVPRETTYPIQEKTIVVF